jgi:hypothetical protein
MKNRSTKATIGRAARSLQQALRSKDEMAYLVLFFGMSMLCRAIENNEEELITNCLGKYLVDSLERNHVKHK